MEITLFKNISDINTPFYNDVSVVFKRIKEGNSKDLINGIRKEEDKEKRNNLKKNLPSICFSGKFTKREDSSLLEHSGLICLDFDKFKTKEELKEFGDFIQKDKFTFGSFISPSGNGYKVVVKIPKDEKNHKLYFDSLKDYYNSDYFDTTSKNISRVCYESYDPKIYVNKDSEIWTDKADYEQFVTIERKPIIKVEDTNEKIKALMIWFDRKYSMLDGQRNNNLYVLASAMNDYGIPKAEVVMFCNQFTQEGFGLNEIEATINSAYSNYANFGSKYFENSKEIENISRKIKTGTNKKDIKDYLKKSLGINDESAEDVINEIEKDTTINDFWSFDNNGNVRIINHKFKYWLEQNGFYKLYPDGSDSFIFVRRQNNLVSDTSESKIKDFVLDYLEKKDNISIYEFFTEKLKYFKEDYLSLLSNVDVEFNRDTKDIAYLYFRNKAVKVTKSGIELLDYMQLNGYVWEKHIIDRDFKVDNNFEMDFSKFIFNISGQDTNKEMSFKTTLGYLLHSFKTSANNVAVILNDEMISETANGGTGKGILINAISKLKRVVIIDGKSFDFAKSFPYQTVTADTHLLVFDDVKRNFNFEFLFSLITEGITLEKKNKDAIKLPIERSPKILISTNYAIKGDGNSFDRRKWDLEFAQHYQKNRTPEDEFGKLLFDDWTNKDWVKFDNYMVSCLMDYLKRGLVESDFNNIDKRRFIAKTSFEFYEWAEDGNLPFDVRIIKSEKFYNFIEEHQEIKKWLTQRRFAVWLEEYGKYKEYNILSGRTTNQRWIHYVDDETNDVIDNNNFDDDEPF